MTDTGILTLGDLKITITSKPDSPAMSPWGDVTLVFENKKGDRTGDVVEVLITNKDRSGKGKFIHADKIRD
ncbi:MAG: hypothetical protein AB9860_03460 [Methanomassiliicoccales archaeon]